MYVVESLWHSVFYEQLLPIVRFAFQLELASDSDRRTGQNKQLNNEHEQPTIHDTDTEAQLLSTPPTQLKNIIFDAN